MDTLLFPFDFFVTSILPFLFVITVVVFFHELGHFLVARWNNVRIDTFSVGFGTRLWSFADRHGTEWRVCLIPLGGYVKFWGDADPSSGLPDTDRLALMTPEERSVCFEYKALWRKSLIVAAGPLANFLLAIVIYTGLFMIQDDVRILPVAGDIVSGSAASEAGIERGDYIISINGNSIDSFDEMREMIILSSGSELDILLRRDDSREFNVSVTPRFVTETDTFGNTYRVPQVGIASDPDSVLITRLDLLGAFTKAVNQTWFVIRATLNFLWELIAGRQDADSLRGPIGIGEMASDFASIGIIPLLSLSGIISISIGLLNLFPIPILDGGHLVFYALEALRGRPLPAHYREWAFRGGMLCILALMIFATSNDLLRLFVG